MFFYEAGIGVSLRIKSQCWKTRTRKTPNTNTFHVVHLSHSVHLSLYLHYFINTENLLNWILLIEKDLEAFFGAVVL